MASLEKAIEIHFPAKVRSLSPDSLASLSQDQRFAYAKVREFFFNKKIKREGSLHIHLKLFFLWVDDVAAGNVSRRYLQLGKQWHCEAIQECDIATSQLGRRMVSSGSILRQSYDKPLRGQTFQESVAYYFSYYFVALTLKVLFAVVIIFLRFNVIVSWHF